MFKKLGTHIRNCHYSFLITVVLPALLTGCIGLDNQSEEGGRKTDDTSVIANTPASVSVGYGRILDDNPIILSGDTNLSASADMNKYLRSQEDLIVLSQQLVGTCKGSQFSEIENCYQVMADEFSSPLVSASGKWAFDANSTEFAQVQAFGHTRRFMDRYLKHFETYVPNVLTAYPSAIPEDSLTGKYYWPKDTLLNHRTMDIFALCDFPDNAQFVPSTYNLCFGYDSIFTNVLFVEDSTVIYHELGHGLNFMMMNLRNNEVGVNLRTNFGGLTFFDELGSLSEGTADYFSYYMNKRTHLGEWALGRFLGADRPISEDDPQHIDGVDTSPEGRLYYPAYLNYWVADTSQPIEDIHFNGKIISHYMVAVTEQLISKCQLSHDDAQAVVMRLHTETLAQLGDLTAKGHEKNTTNTNYVNLNSNHSYDWFRINYPVTFRSYAQTWAKFMKYLLVDNTSNNVCTSGAFTTDDIETLLDDYGLLLFATYNEDGNGHINDLTADPGNAGPRTKISLSSRQKSKLINKDFLILDPRANKASAFIFDKREDMLGVISALNVSGSLQSSISEQIPSDLIYNNGNGLVSPGEFLGILPNIYNDHTETIAGVQILANDWDHFKGGKPCNNMGDSFPTFSEGAASLTTGEGTPGGCDYVTRMNGDEAAEELAPVCFVQLNETNSTRWASQKDLISHINLDPKKCLGGESSQNDCFLRAVKGGETSHFSKIDPKDSWLDTLQDSNGKPQFNISNLLFFEVSPWIPPGTQFNCRMRARFVNCDDCYHDKNKDDDNFLDYEYSGGKPFKLINFSFRVVD